MTDVNRFVVRSEFAKDPAMVVCDCKVSTAVVAGFIYLEFEDAVRDGKGVERRDVDDLRETTSCWVHCLYRHDWGNRQFHQGQTLGRVMSMNVSSVNNELT